MLYYLLSALLCSLSFNSFDIYGTHIGLSSLDFEWIPNYKIIRFVFLLRNDIIENSLNKTSSGK